MLTKKFNRDLMLTDMYDAYYPRKCVDKVKDVIQGVVTFLEESPVDLVSIQTKFDQMCNDITALNEFFWENDSEIETVARDSIFVTVREILEFFKINIDADTATQRLG